MDQAAVSSSVDLAREQARQQQVAGPAEVLDSGRRACRFAHEIGATAIRELAHEISRRNDAVGICRFAPARGAGLLAPIACLLQFASRSSSIAEGVDVTVRHRRPDAITNKIR